MEYIQLNKESGSTTRINFNNGVPYISYRILDDIPWLKNAVSTRLGGVSKDYLASMNLGFNRGDLDENVIRNHEIFANAIGVNPKNIVTGNQTHTTNVKVVTKDDCGKGIYRDRNYTDIDGLITNEKGIVLATYYADCVPLLIVDTKNKAIGLSHNPALFSKINSLQSRAITATASKLNLNKTDNVILLSYNINLT